MQNLDAAKKEALMKSEAERIVAEGRKRDLHLRLLGALAFQLHCPKHVYLSKKLGRVLSDIDFAAYGGQLLKVQVKDQSSTLGSVVSLQSPLRSPSFTLK
jgi:hypothetical protein